ncbi:MAG TPA: alternative ribosome rescue aminoacyl-tRNA hydrolase ArfB [Candidatus Binatia bacterium]|jgi:ribosome-associated protein
MTGRGIEVRKDVVIPPREITLTFVRASGPGGQNVNKVASKAVLRFNVRDSPSLTAAQRERALARLASRLTSEGELILHCAEERQQARNREALLARFATVMRTALRVSRTRRPSRPSARAVERRLADKRARSERKRERRTLD